MQELLLKRKHLFFLHFFTNYCESFRTHMIIFACPKRKFRPKKRDPLRKFHRTYGLPLENYLSDRANHYRKCLTVRRPLGNTGVGEKRFNEFNKFNNTRARMLDSIYHMTNTLKSHFWRKNVILLSLCTQRCYGRHNVSRKSIIH